MAAQTERMLPEGSTPLRIAACLTAGIGALLTLPAMYLNVMLVLGMLFEEANDVLLAVVMTIAFGLTVLTVWVGAVVGFYRNPDQVLSAARWLILIAVALISTQVLSLYALFAEGAVSVLTVPAAAAAVLLLSTGVLCWRLIRRYDR